MLDGPGAVTMTVTELAKRHGATKQAISQRVKRLEEKHPDFAPVRDAAGRIVAVPVAAFEELIGRFGDQAKAPARKAADGGAAAKAGSLDHARLVQARVGAERAALQLAREKGELIRKDLMEDALAASGAEIAAIVDRLPNLADDLAAAVATEGAAGARRSLKAAARSMRDEIAARLAALHAASPAEDPGLEDADADPELEFAE